MRELPATVRNGYDRQIGDHVRALDAYRGAEQLLLYFALADEVSLESLIDGAVADGKRLFLPSSSADGALVYRSWARGARLARAPHGVAEPVTGDAPAARPSLILVPGRAFDGSGGRVGRGMGCFDRTLAGLRALGPTVGVAYSCQLVARVPTEPHDQDVDIVVTERGVARSGDGDGRQGRRRRDGRGGDEG